MKLKEFLQSMEKETEDFINMKYDFDLGIDTNMNVVGESKNRIRFSIIKIKPKKR